MLAKYIRNIQKTLSSDQGKEQKDTFPYFKLNQSMKSSNDILWSSIYTLGQVLKVYKKTYLIA